MVTETFDLAALAYARWKRAVDLLVREVVRRREAQARQEESARNERRVRNLRRIVRRALSEYSRIQISRQGMASRSEPVARAGLRPI